MKILIGEVVWIQSAEACLSDICVDVFYVFYCRVEDISKSSSKARTENEPCWIRPLGYTEKFMTSASKIGNMKTLYAVWIESKRHLNINDVKHVSKMMYGKMPHLQLSVGKHKKDLWWKVMSSDVQDVEEISTDEDVQSLFESLSKHSYDIEKGPLWFVRLVTGTEKTNASDSHKYILVFGFHHNFSDGTSNMIFCNNFVLALNDYFLNKELLIKEEGYFASPIHDEIANKDRSELELAKYFSKRFCSGLLSFNKAIKNFLTYYPLPYHDKSCGQTNVLFAELDETSTEKLLRRCHMEKVTLNSAFTAVANIALYKMILLKDKNILETTFHTQHAVNMRRYWPKDKQNLALGCHISMANISIPTQLKDMENFWEYARRIHETIRHDLIVKKTVLKVQPLSEKLCLVIFANYLLAQLKWPSTNDSHYCVTNMGDISSLIETENQIVNITKIHRSVVCHYMQVLKYLFLIIKS
ncbi:hypothetical protein Anas_00537 [Armadillidium nasatum]|uniref:Condensation domain-containing protein n=1 Tax=Armadillidium nasatum TaxID=96803 RepID=A0A5N5SWQ7_9CRUS|nr:hypothetical protein Anas_00537 [Armadillidium nasatum]